MQVLVAGGDGFIGRPLCAELAERGHDVTAMSRSAPEDPLPDGVTHATGDVTDYESIEPVVDGHDAVVNLVALSPLFTPSGGEEQHFSVHLEGTRYLVAAAEETGADRFLQQSALGADPQGPTNYIRAKGQAEKVVRDSSLDWTITRPSVVFGEGGEFVTFTKLLAPPYVTPLPGGGKTRFQPIHVADLVPMLADAVEKDEHVGETYDIGGPETLTMAEVARLGHRADGRGVNVLPIPMPIAKIGLSVLDYVPGFPFGSDQFRSLQMDNTVDDNDVSAFGVDEGDLTTLSAFLKLD
ncbi:complex I NDUFA9 subunit family protein [Halolamina salifodinae]|uniref:NADH dehydrogenase n=1 Tax=Halolamina salifodinae TaxID=1202767 RepID=A0A8T4GYS0_9EURY|nr:complex I NDUFA9 subunit family protein [Halolamina salifodinae]MBP1988157.1 NADH dehydrogenase [Halolamina salifodinae]